MIMFIVAMSAIIFAGFFIQGVTGFGATLFVMSIALLITQRELVMPICLLYTLFQSFTIVYKNYKNVNVKHLLISLSFAIIAGVPAGNYLIEHINDRTAKAVFAVFLLAYSIISLLGRLKNDVKEADESSKSPNIGSYLFLIASGCFQFMYGVGGPALVAYLSRVVPHKDTLRTTICAYWLILNSIILLYGVTQHSFTIEIKLALLLMPGFLLGGALGSYVAWRINQRYFMIFVFSVLSLSSLLILSQTL